MTSDNDSSDDDDDSDDNAVGLKPSASSSQPPVKKPHGGHVGNQIEQYDLGTGRTIALFDSQNAAARAIGIGQGGISACARGEYGSKSAGGFGWRRPGTGAGASAGVANGNRQSRPISRPFAGTYSRLFICFPSPYLKQSAVVDCCINSNFFLP